MKRTPLRAKKVCPHCSKSLCGCGKTPALRKSRLESTGPIKPINRKRRARLFSEGFESEERVSWYRHQFCVVPGCDEGPCEVAHVKSRGAGGTADDAVPMCHAHHREQHDIGIRTFEGKYGLWLEAMAKFYAMRWKQWSDV